MPLGGLNSEPAVQPTALSSVILCNVVGCLVVCQAPQHGGYGDRHSVPAFLGSTDAEQLRKPGTSLCQVPGTTRAAPVTLGNRKSCQSKKQEAIKVWLALDGNNGRGAVPPSTAQLERVLQVAGALRGERQCSSRTQGPVARVRSATLGCFRQPR